jgi:hypothetical protein
MKAFRVQSVGNFRIEVIVQEFVHERDDLRRHLDLLPGRLGIIDCERLGASALEP